MNLGKTLTDLATAPVRVGLAVADAGLGIANDALGIAQRTLGVANSRARSGSGSFAHILGIDDAVERANRLARLMDEDQPLGRALTPGGVLSGYTIVERQAGKSHHEHEYEFKSKEDLLRLIEPYFRNVRIFETIYPSRHNLYFFAGDAVLPFDAAWPPQIARHLAGSPAM